MRKTSGPPDPAVPTMSLPSTDSTTARLVTESSKPGRAGIEHAARTPWCRRRCRASRHPRTASAAPVVTSASRPPTPTSSLSLSVSSRMIAVASRVEVRDRAIVLDLDHLRDVDRLRSGRRHRRRSTAHAAEHRAGIATSAATRYSSGSSAFGCLIAMYWLTLKLPVSPLTAEDEWQPDRRPAPGPTLSSWSPPAGRRRGRPPRKGRCCAHRRCRGRNPRRPRK